MGHLRHHLTAVVTLAFAAWATRWLLVVPGVQYRESVVTATAFGLGAKSWVDAARLTFRKTKET